MDFRTQRRTLEVLSDLFQRKPQVGRVRFRPQRAGGRGVGYTGMPLPRSSPEREGLSSRQLLEFLRRAQVHPTINPHTLMVLRHGKVVCSCSFAPYREDVWHVTHSMCKSLTALAVGMLVGEGKLSLEEHICDIFPGRLSPLANPLAFRRMKAVTVRHLLTMSSGVNFNEAGAVTSEDWLGDFFSSGVGFEPGAKFAYNSMNSYVLSCIVRERSGMGLTEFLRPRLFAPLSMGRLHWEKSPQGVEKGGWGLYLFPEDMAKLGQLFLQEGVWDGRRLVPREFLEEMCSPQMATPPEMGEQGYGFQLWMGKRPGSYLCNGILGQNIIVLPDVDMVVVTTGGNDCLFKTSTTISLVEDGTLVASVLTQKDLYKKMISNMEEVRTRGAFVMAVTTEGNTEVERAADYVIYIPETNKYFTNSLAIIPLQLFAYYIAVGRGCDVDKPRNLAKSVTVE